MRIGILNCGHFAQRVGQPVRDYDVLYSEMLAGHGFTFRAWHVVDMDFPESVDQADGWLLGGSRHGVYDDIPFIEPLKAFVREAYAAVRPTVGICFGHQLIAEALGGRAQKFAGGWAMGHTSYDFGGQDLTLNAFHQDQVVEVPPGATVIARNDTCDVAALAYDGPAMSIQAHPEFGASEMELLYDTRAPKLVDADMIDSARARAALPNDNAVLADRIARFFKEMAT